MGVISDHAREFAVLLVPLAALAASTGILIGATSKDLFETEKVKQTPFGETVEREQTVLKIDTPKALLLRRFVLDTSLVFFWMFVVLCGIMYYLWSVESFAYGIEGLRPEWPSKIHSADCVGFYTNIRCRLLASLVTNRIDWIRWLREVSLSPTTIAWYLAFICPWIILRLAKVVRRMAAVRADYVQVRMGIQ